ncbi:MAG: prepilin-type N-terminal cleavage/methylation domain-containing protein [Bacilli bacterium]|nr:prepilin-type N-terminal cleavage/methylation domain-containing protein [Bacilli bacterium]
MKLNNKGFTLIEILAVVAIIAILGGIATLSIINTINSGKNTSNRIMIEDIMSASQILYEEINYGDNEEKLYHYSTSGKTNNEITITDNSIEVRLQTLVSNGFLNGSENPCYKNSDEGIINNNDDYEETTCTNNNKRIIRDPKSKEDIGTCKIKIVNNEGDYTITAINDPSVTVTCPTTYERLSKR